MATLNASPAVLKRGFHQLSIVRQRCIKALHVICSDNSCFLSPIRLYRGESTHRSRIDIAMLPVIFMFCIDTMQMFITVLLSSFDRLAIILHDTSKPIATH